MVEGTYNFIQCYLCVYKQNHFKTHEKVCDHIWYAVIPLSLEVLEVLVPLPDQYIYTSHYSTLVRPQHPKREDPYIYTSFLHKLMLCTLWTLIFLFSQQTRGLYTHKRLPIYTPGNSQKPSLNLIWSYNCKFIALIALTHNLLLQGMSYIWHANRERLCVVKSSPKLQLL